MHSMTGTFTRGYAQCSLVLQVALCVYAFSLHIIQLCVFFEVDMPKLGTSARFELRLSDTGICLRARAGEVPGE